MCWGITCDIALEGRWRRSRVNTTPLPDTGVPKTQTTSVKMGEFGVFCTRWSAFWVPRPSDRPLDGGNCTTRGCDTPATRRKRASCSAKPPPSPVWRVLEGPEGLAAVPVGGGRAWPRQISHAIPPRHDPTQAQKPQNINDQISKPEILSGELHAKLLSGKQDEATHSNESVACVREPARKGRAWLRCS